MPADIASVNAALPARVVAPFARAGRKIFLHDVNAEAHWEEKGQYPGHMPDLSVWLGYCAMQLPYTYPSHSIRWQYA